MLILRLFPKKILSDKIRLYADTSMYAEVLKNAPMQQ